MQYPSSPLMVTRSVFRVSCLLILLVLLGACREQTPVTTTRFDAFDTQVDLSLVGVSQEQASQAVALIERDFAYLQQDWHPWKPSPLGRVNRMLQTDRPFVAPPSVMPLVRISRVFETQSGGLFNPSIGYLMELWGFHTDQPDSRAPPSAAQIADLVKANPRMAQIDLDGLELRGHNSMLKLDFSAIARGYAIDLAIEHLRDMGVDNALLQAGGDLRVIGDRSGQPWRIPIRRSSGSGVFAILPVRGNESVATTADYDRNFIFRGTLYHAIIDPRTGRPAEGTRAVTVVHGDTTTAAAAATAIFIAGPTQWRAVAEGMGIRYALLVDSQGTVHMNPGMAERIELIDSNIAIALSPPLATEASRIGP